MLQEAIRLGCEIYHGGVTSEYDNGYTQYLDDKDQLKWDCPDRLDILEIEKLRVFLNEKWRARIQMEDKGRDLRPDLLRTLQSVLPHLAVLRNTTILDAEFGDGDVSQLIICTLDAIARYGPRKYESTAASKILHTINPELFVMWDRAIRGGYGLGEDNANKNSQWKREGVGYADYFLPRMQRLAHLAIEQVKGITHDPIDLLRSPNCSHSLAKILDEYNYAKFTLNHDSVWKKEYDL